MSIPSGTTDFPLGHNFAITVGGRTFLLDAIDLPEKTTRVINRTNQNGDANDYQIRQAGEKITGTATLQRLDTSTAPPKSGDSILWTTEDDANADYMLGYVTDVKVSRSKDSADVFEIGFLVEDFLDINYGITTGDFTATRELSFTANGDTGFTVSNDTTEPYTACGIELAEALPSPKKLYCSFDCTFVSGSPTPQFSLLLNGVGGSISDNNTVAEGFNYIELNTIHWNATHVGFRDSDAGSYTISDFQISRSPLTSTKLVRLSNVGGLTSNQFFFAQGDLNGFAQTLDTSSTSGLVGVDSNYTTIGRVKYDLGASAGTNKTIQFKVAYPSNKQISGTHDFTRFSNLSVLSTEIVGNFKFSIIQGDANITSRNSVLIGLDLEDA